MRYHDPGVFHVNTDDSQNVSSKGNGMKTIDGGAGNKLGGWGC